MTTGYILPHTESSQILMDKEKRLRAAVTELRTRLKLSQQDFSDRIGKVRDMVYRYEKNKAPSGDALAQLALLARSEGHRDLEDIFRLALIEDLPDVARLLLEKGNTSTSDPEKALDFDSFERDNLELSEEVRKHLTMCIAVLRSGDADALDAVKSNLRLFYRVVGGDPDNVKPLSIHPARRARARP